MIPFTYDVNVEYNDVISVRVADLTSILTLVGVIHVRDKDHVIIEADICNINRLI